MNYDEFIKDKALRFNPRGLDDTGDISEPLFDWQASIVRWALRKGCACLFQDCGLGKTIQQLEWAHHIPGDVIVFAPLAVAEQTVSEAHRFGYDAAVSDDGKRKAKITVTNYEKLHKFNLAEFSGVVLDESSILKSHTGRFRTEILEQTRSIPYRLACTATPAPNDVMELANHAEFVGAMTRNEMLARFFTHDGGDTSKWRLKGHAKADFWGWVASWAVMVRTPNDLGYDACGYELPQLNMHEHVLVSGIESQDDLFSKPAITLTEQRRARKSTMHQRAAKVASIVNDSSDQFIVWCELNAEGDLLESMIPDSIQVSGSDKDDAKKKAFAAFANGGARVIVTKPKIAGFGLNWQHCSNQAFVGLSHSWEQFYQAVRRSWRFGQENAVNIHLVTTDVEMGVLENIKRKQDMADDMAAEMVKYMEATMKDELQGKTGRLEINTTGGHSSGHGWDVYHDDVVHGLSTRIEDNSVGFSIFSPPFASLYTYTDDARDMGNVDNDAQFFEQFDYLVKELYRVTKPGRLVSFHCMDLPTTKARDGYIGIRDFRGDLIKAFERHGFILHSQVVIWKDPVTAMQRTKALGLLWKQLKKDSTRSRQGIPDYLVTMVKPGDNAEPVSHTAEEFPVQLWQNYASPVWMDINPSDTLQYRSARDHDDERHICPLQLGVIRRAMKMWSNPGDLVLSPFTGIGSEGHVALEMGRRFVGFELKDSYYRQACKNLAIVASQPNLL